MLVYWRVDRIWKCQKISPRIGMVLKSPCSINYCTWWLYHIIQIYSDMGICIKIYRDRNGQKNIHHCRWKPTICRSCSRRKNPWVFHICSYVFLRVSSWKKSLIYCPLIFLLIPTKGREWGYDPIHNYCHLFFTPRRRWVWGSTMSGVEIPSGTPPRMPGQHRSGSTPRHRWLWYRWWPPSCNHSIGKTYDTI